MDLNRKTERKKRRFPLFDVALLLLLALTVAAGVYWVMHRGETPTAELVCTVRFSGVDNAYSGTFAEGETLYTSSGAVLGEVRAVAVSRTMEAYFDAQDAEPDAAGLYAYTYARSDQKSDVLLTVHITAEMRDGGYFVGSNRIASGVFLDAMVPGYRGQAMVLTLTREEEQS